MRHGILTILLLLPTRLLAQGNAVGSAYLKIPMDARVGALGEASVADPIHFSSSFSNPAILATSVSPEIRLTHVQWIQSVQNEFLGVSVPLPEGNLGFAISSTNVDGIEVRDIPGPAAAMFTARSGTLQLLYGVHILDDLSVGTTVKYIYEKIYIDEASGVGIDLGALLRMPLDGFFLGASLNNLGRMSKFRATAAELPSQAQLGGSYLVVLPDLTISMNGSLVRELQPKSSRLNLGAELRYDETLSLRVGYQTGFESRNISTGLGLKYSFVQLDYAYIPFLLKLGNVHIISAGFSL